MKPSLILPDENSLLQILTSLYIQFVSLDFQFPNEYSFNYLAIVCICTRVYGCALLWQVHVKAKDQCCEFILSHYSTLFIYFETLFFFNWTQSLPFQLDWMESKPPGPGSTCFHLSPALELQMHTAIPRFFLYWC